MSDNAATYSDKMSTVGGFRTCAIKDGLIFDETAGMLPSRLSGYCGSSTSEFGSPVSTTFGIIYEGSVTLESSGHSWSEITSGFFFAAIGGFRLSGSGKAALFERVGMRGMFQLGGPLEQRGRLMYLDGCTDSLLIFPQRQGDPCVNALWFPSNVRQTMHLHPTLRLALVVSGRGRCVTPHGELPLRAGNVFALSEMSRHCFHTDDDEMTLVTYHPDSDWGPTDPAHPLINRTFVGTNTTR